MAITTEIEAWAKDHCRSGIDMRHELEAFRTYSLANNRAYHDYDAAFQSWLLKANQFGTSAASRRSPPGVAFSGPVSEANWRARVADYFNGGTCDGPWLDGWGFRPDEELCAAPPDVVAEVMGGAHLATHQRTNRIRVAGGDQQKVPRSLP